MSDVAPAPTPAHARSRRAATILELGFLLPVLALSVAVVILPAAISIVRSLYDWHPGYESQYVGLDNYTTLLDDKVFHQVVKNQAVLLIALPFWVVLPLALALLLYKQVPAPGLFRTIFFLPAVMSSAVLGILFRSILSVDGPLNGILRTIGLDSLTRSWLSDPALVKPVIIALIVWAGLGTGVVIFSAALSGVDHELFEAAEVDGASWWQQLWTVAIPSIRHVVYLWLYLGTVTIFLFSFGWVYVLTRGGPGYASATVDFDVYRRAFGRGEFGMAAAEAVVLLVTFIVVVGIARVVRRWLA